MRHPTYKHLEAKLRLGAFSLGQWAQIGIGAVFAAVFGVYASPFPPTVTIFVSIVAAGLPVAVSYGAMGLEFSVAQFAVAAWRYVREPRRYLPGDGATTSGYFVQASASETSSGPASGTRERHDAEGQPLWDL